MKTRKRKKTPSSSDSIADTRFQSKWTPPKVDDGVPSGPLRRKWIDFTAGTRQLSPEKKKASSILIAGGGLSACACAAALAEQGYNVRVITNLESPRHENTSYLRGGLNASRNYANDGDSDDRFFRDTMEYGGWQSREADVFRMAQLSGRILDICVALCVPFLREEGGMLLPRPYPGGTTARSFQAHGHTGRQLLIAFYSALLRQCARGCAVITGRREITEIVVKDGHARGIIARNKLNGNEEAYSADAVVLACGGYSDLYNSVPNHISGGINAIWAAYRAGAALANPCFSLSLPGNSNKWRNVPEDYNTAQRCPGGLWTDYMLKTTLPGLFAIGEANFSVHGANCMPGNAPLQELADGLFILPASIGEYLAKNELPPATADDIEFSKAIDHSKKTKERLMSAHGKNPPQYFHRKLSQIMRDKAGFIRYSFRLQQALQEIRSLRKEFYSTLLVPEIRHYNTIYETAFKTASCLDFSEIIVKDALLRKESCGAHFRMDYSPDINEKEERHYTRLWFRSPSSQDIPVQRFLELSEHSSHNNNKADERFNEKNSSQNAKKGRFSGKDKAGKDGKRRKNKRNG